jgi:hypothetical protein
MCLQERRQESQVSVTRKILTGCYYNYCVLPRVISGIMWSSFPCGLKFRKSALERFLSSEISLRVVRWESTRVSEVAGQFEQETDVEVTTYFHGGFFLSLLFYPEDRYDMFLEKLRLTLNGLYGLYPRRQNSSWPPLWELLILHNTLDCHLCRGHTAL